jgi:catechol 2,3-dioxygenase-like lactoylglutathione lyase family enzyme
MEDVRLEHAFLYVRDIERTLTFYRKLMPGWTIRWEGHGYGTNRWIHWGPPGEGSPGYLSLCEHFDPEAKPAGEDTMSVRHVGFTHPDVAALCDRMAKDGIATTDRTEDAHYRRAYFRDPDGHDLEVVQRF